MLPPSTEDHISVREVRLERRVRSNKNRVPQNGRQFVAQFGEVRRVCLNEVVALLLRVIACRFGELGIQERRLGDKRVLDQLRKTMEFEDAIAKAAAVRRSSSR